MEEASTPTTIGEIAVHLKYIIKSIEELKDQVEKVGTRFCSQEDFNKLEVTVKEHEEKIESFSGYKMWLMGAVAVIIAFQGLIIYSAKSYISSVVKEVLSENYNVE